MPLRSARHVWGGIAVAGVVLLLTVVFFSVGRLKPRSAFAPDKVYFLPSEKDEESYQREDPFFEPFFRAKTQVIGGKWPALAVLDSGLDVQVAGAEGLIAEEVAQWFHNTTPYPLTDDLSHGTGLFLQLAARKNGFGILGLVPEAPVFSIKIANSRDLNEGRPSFGALKAAFALAKQKNIRVLVLSISAVNPHWKKEEMDRLLAPYQEDFLVVTAAGNDAMNLEYGPGCRYVPICNQAPNLIKVGALDFSFSNRGPVVDVQIPSLSWQWRRIQLSSPDVVYELKALRTTSVAASKVAALAALSWKACRRCNPGTIRSSMLSAAGPQGIDPGEVIGRLGSE